MSQSIDRNLDRLYGGMATVVAFIPVIWSFFIWMAIVEDSGYLSRYPNSSAANWVIVKKP